MSSRTIEARIQQALRLVSQELRLRDEENGLQPKVLALKRYQQRRFERSYAQLLSTPRYGAAARFFLDELYGPQDFSRRDAQFARVVPALVKLFPAEVVATVEQLARLHALSEQLDTRMARRLPALPVGAATYAQAWQDAGSPAERAEQVELLLSVGQALDGLTRKPLLRQALRMMRKPAAAAGLAELQAFLERGFDCFKAMGGATEFLQTVATRERALAGALFAPTAPRMLSTPGFCPSGDDPLGQLP